MKKIRPASWLAGARRFNRHDSGLPCQSLQTWRRGLFSTPSVRSPEGSAGTWLPVPAVPACRFLVGGRMGDPPPAVPVPVNGERQCRRRPSALAVPFFCLGKIGEGAQCCPTRGPQSPPIATPTPRFLFGVKGHGSLCRFLFFLEDERRTKRWTSA